MATIARHGLLVIKGTDPLSPARKIIIIPRQVLDGLLTAFHIQLCHHSDHQLKSVVKHNFFALDMDNAISHVTQGCQVCASLHQPYQDRIEQCSSPPTDVVGVAFAADVVSARVNSF